MLLAIYRKVRTIAVVGGIIPAEDGMRGSHRLNLVEDAAADPAAQRAAHD